MWCGGLCAREHCWGADLRVQFGMCSLTSPQPLLWLCALEGGLSCKLRVWGSCFFPLGSLWAQKGGRGKNQESEKQDDKSDRFWIKMKLQCWMMPDSKADEKLAFEGPSQTSPFPGDAAARLPTKRAVGVGRCTVSTLAAQAPGLP